MGVPKFNRWICERYPCLIEVVKEYQIPEFDNLYLDMNGIIHICSHPNDNDPHFRISEEKIFKDIFHYIEVLFRLIQPRQVFFMAVDGVAPRAKMNQQRCRRFRSAKEAVDAEKKAQERGEALPSEERFDSNCITPGTEFMDRLDAQLQYFVTRKVSQDRLWQRCKVVYSSHQTPGEGEHKIMEYIRFTKSQNGYNPSTRHCFYGLDADLIILGLTTHEPHFSLLREEVRFGGKKDSRHTSAPEATTFHLLHLSLMREYINYEFWDLHHALPFSYDLESIIDDWVLMGFLVGNDFIPHLPNLHINKEALPILYQTYKDVLPTLDGYLNNGGTLHLGRFEIFMSKLSEFELEQFHEQNADLKYFQSKRLENGKAFKANKSSGNSEIEQESFGSDNDAFLLDAPFGDLEEDEDDDGLDDLCKTYEKLNYKPNPIFVAEQDSDNEESIFNAEFRQHKREYYMSKMEYKYVNSEVLYEQATSYVRGIQWTLNYYYNGICSWSWFYPHHYSPYISDIKGFANMQMNFERGKPFMPFEQLLSVLPPLSKNLLPYAYQGLMTKEDSPLKEYYPDTFFTDLNGKQQDWEAVVLIPFIDETRLLEAMKPCNERLTKEEKSRNVAVPMGIYTYTPDNLGEYKAPKYFLPVGINHATVQFVRREEWELMPEKVYKGLCKDARLDVYFAGFPTLKHIDHKFHIAKEEVKVFQHNSRGENLILDITEPEEDPDLKDVSNKLLGKVIFVSWPHLHEAKVEAVSDGKERYVQTKGEVQIHVVKGHSKEEFVLSKNNIISHYHDRWGVEVGKTNILVYAAPITGRKYVPDACGRMSLEKEWCKIVQPYAYQTIVKDITVHDPGYKQNLTAQEYFPQRSKVFMLGQPHYGCMGEVIEIDPSHKGRIRVAMTVAPEPNFDVVKQRQNQLVEKYMTGYIAAQRIGISSHLLARLTGTIFLVPPSGTLAETETRAKLSIGLNLKDNKRNEEVSGYSRKSQELNEKSTWLYSDLTVETLVQYQKKFPEIFLYLAMNIGQKDIFFQDEVFGQENYKERVAELTEWLKNSDFAKAQRQPCGTQALGETIVSRLVEEVDKVSSVRAKIVKMQVRPHLLFKPNPLQGSTPPDHTVSYKMFDRVINVRECFSVPLGAKGTVIGIQPAKKEADVFYDILFDEAFPGGMTLRGPSSAQRCYRLHWAAMINISHGDRSPSVNNHRVGSSSGSSQQKWQQSKQQDRGASPLHQTIMSHTVQLGPDFKPTKDGRGKETNAKVPPNSHTFQSHKASKLNDPSSVQPPDPNQLPSPSGLCKNTHNHNHSGVSNGDIAMKKQSPRNHQDKLVLMKYADEVESIVYGSYYASWSKIMHQGLWKTSGQNFIPCYPFVPRDMTGPKAYQLYIFLDVRKAMSDGMKFFKVGNRQILCSGDRQGHISPKYFMKVLDSETGIVIFPSRPAMNPESGVRIGQGQEDHGCLPVGHGRGRAMSSQQTQGLQLYQNIWSQVQRIDPDHTDLLPMQSHMLSQLLNISNDNAAVPSHQVMGGGLPSKSASGKESAPSRMEVSVQDIFKGAVGQNQVQVSHHPQGALGQTDFMSMLGAAQQPHKLAQPGPRNQKAGSPSKSAFVPTQVIRNQTPRKPRSDHLGNFSGKQDSSTNSNFNQQQQQHPSQQSQYQHHQQQHPQQNSKPDGMSGKQKRHARNRLAVKFDQPLGKNE